MQKFTNFAYHFPETPIVFDGSHWQGRLAALIDEHRVPGASLGIMRLTPDGRHNIVSVASGVLNTETQVPVTTESLFQIGSITKVWTATLVMQLVDEGLLDLDAPVRAALPNLKLADSTVAERVTMRGLLTHTSGIDGDIFVDPGRGNGSLKHYVKGLANVGQLHRLGSAWSYCNSGYCIAGRVIEVLTGMTFEDVMRERLFEPLGLAHTVMLPEEALLHSTAVGHVGKSAAELRRTPVWGLPRAIGPAGLICSNPRDVLTWVRMHLEGGRTAAGQQLVSAESAAEMAAEQTTLPRDVTLASAWGLGWAHFTWNEHHLIGHNGLVIGQAAFLRVLPERGIAVVLLTNGGNTQDLYEALFSEVFRDLANVKMPTALSSGTAPTVNPARLGIYERAGQRIVVGEREGGLFLRFTATDADDEDSTVEAKLTEIGPDQLAFQPPGAVTNMPVYFTWIDGRAYLYQGFRAYLKTS